MSQPLVLEILRREDDWVGYRALFAEVGIRRDSFQTTMRRLVRQGRVLRREEMFTYVNAAGRRLRQLMSVYRIADSERVYNLEPFADIPWLNCVNRTTRVGVGRCYSPLGAWE